MRIVRARIQNIVSFLRRTLYTDSRLLQCCRLLFLSLPTLSSARRRSMRLLTLLRFSNESLSPAPLQCPCTFFSPVLCPQRPTRKLGGQHTPFSSADRISMLSEPQHRIFSLNALYISVPQIEPFLIKLNIDGCRSPLTGTSYLDTLSTMYKNYY